MPKRKAKALTAAEFGDLIRGVRCDEDALRQNLALLGITVSRAPQIRDQVAVPCCVPGCQAKRIVSVTIAQKVSQCLKHATEHKRMLSNIRQREYRRRQALSLRLDGSKPLI
jgi:hypothetical protein